MSFTYTPPLAASRWRDVHIAAAARAVSSCGGFMAVTALVLTLQPRGGYVISALILATTVPTVVLAPLAGRLADRTDSRTLLVVTGAAQAATGLLLAFAADLPTVIVLVALLGAGQAVVGPTLAALTPAMVRRDDLPRAGAINQTAGMVGMLTGPAVAGVLVGGHGARLPLLLHALSLVTIAIAGLLVRTRRGGAPAAGPGAGGAPDAVVAPPSGDAAAAAVRWSVWSDPLLRVMVLSFAAVIGAIGVMNVIEVFLVRETLMASPAMYGLLEAVWTAGMLAGTWLLARYARRARDDGALMYATLALLGMLCAAVALAATVGSAVWLVPLWIAGGGANGGLNVFSSVLMAHRTPEASRGRAFATVGAAVQGAGMAGYLAGGPLVEALATRPLVAGLGLAGLAVVGLLAVPVVRAVRRERVVAGAAEPVGA
jgi:MFS family permease